MTEKIFKVYVEINEEYGLILEVGKIISGFLNYEDFDKMEKPILADIRLQHAGDLGKFLIMRAVPDPDNDENPYRFIIDEIIDLKETIILVD